MAAFRSVCAREERPAGVPARREPPAAPPPASARFTALIAERLAAYVERVLDPVLAAVIDGRARWSFAGADGFVLEPCVLRNDAVAALYGGTARTGNVRVGRTRVALPPLGGLLAGTAVASVSVASIEYDVAPFPTFLAPAVLADVLRSIYGEARPGAENGKPARYGSSAKLLDRVEVSVASLVINVPVASEASLRERLAATAAPAPARARPRSALWSSSGVPSSVASATGGAAEAEVTRLLRDAGAGGCRTHSFADVRYTNGAGGTRFRGAAVQVHKRLTFRDLRVDDADSAGSALPFARPVDGDCAITLTRTVADGALVEVAVAIAQKADALHLLFPSLPVSLCVALRLSIGDGPRGEAVAAPGADSISEDGDEPPATPPPRRGTGLFGSELKVVLGDDGVVAAGPTTTPAPLREESEIPTIRRWLAGGDGESPPPPGTRLES